MVIIDLFPSLFQEGKKQTKPFTYLAHLYNWPHIVFGFAVNSIIQTRYGCLPRISACAAVPGLQCDSNEA